MKTCNIESCNNNVFSKGVCKYHTPRKSINKVSKKQVVKNIEKKTLYQKQLELFELHWTLKAHKCEICNKYLGEENKTIFHDHLAEKSKFQHLRFEIKNLILVCFSCHELKTNGFPKPKHQEFINKVYEHFNIIK